MIIKWDVLLVEKYFWWLLRRVKNLRSTACKHYRKCNVIYRYLHIELIWCLFMVPCLPKQCYYEMDYSFYSFYWLDSLEIRLDHNSTYYRSLSKNSDVKPRISHWDSQNLQYKPHPEFWPSHRQIFKTSLYYKAPYIRDKTVSVMEFHLSSFIFHVLCVFDKWWVLIYPWFSARLWYLLC